MVDHDRLSTGEHCHAGGMDAKLQIDVEALLLVVPAVACEVERPRRPAARRVVNRDLLQRLACPEQSRGALSRAEGQSDAADEDCKTRTNQCLHVTPPPSLPPELSG